MCCPTEDCLEMYRCCLSEHVSMLLDCRASSILRTRSLGGHTCRACLLPCLIAWYCLSSFAFECWLEVKADCYWWLVVASGRSYRHRQLKDMRMHRIRVKQAITMLARDKNTPKSGMTRRFAGLTGMKGYVRLRLTDHCDRSSSRASATGSPTRPQSHNKQAVGRDTR